MDNTVKIWSMKDKAFNALVHSNYVDCNRWLGDFILSKSVDNEIVLWEPKVKEQTPGEGVVDILQKYPVPECDIWFIKFSCDFHYKAAAIGNREGKIFVWELQSSPPILIARFVSFYLIKFISMNFYGQSPCSGCCMLNQNLQSGRLLCPMMEVLFCVAVRTGQYGAGIMCTICSPTGGRSGLLV